jgi:hypothetical protein
MLLLFACELLPAAVLHIVHEDVLHDRSSPGLWIDAQSCPSP